MYTLQRQIHPTQIPLGYASDAAALDVGLELSAVEITIKPLSLLSFQDLLSPVFVELFDY